MKALLSRTMLIAVVAMSLLGGFAAAPQSAEAHGTYAGKYSYSCWGSTKYVNYTYIYGWNTFLGAHFHTFKIGRCG